MCDPYNDIDCSITFSTIGTPDATFVAQQVGDDLQFRGVQLSGGIIGVLTPDTLTLDSLVPPNPLPIDGIIGVFDSIRYSLLNPLLWPTEINFNLLSSTYNTGMFAGDTLTIPVSTYYKVCFNPISVTNSLPNGATIIYRLRDDSGNIYAEFYARSISNDENTNSFCHVMLLPAGTYTFSVQAIDMNALEYPFFLIQQSSFSVNRVSL